MNLNLPAILLISSMTLPVATSVHAEGLDGVSFLITNKFQGDATDGKEVDVASFGLNNNLFSTVANDVELPEFITLYDVDVSTDLVRFKWIESEFSKEVGGPMPADKLDRNYFVFDLPDGKSITSVTFDEDGSDLIDGSAKPTATLISKNKFVTEFASGVIRVKGFNPQYKIVVE